MSTYYYLFWVCWKNIDSSCLWHCGVLYIQANHAVLDKEIQSPRFQAILRVTSGRKKRTPDIKSFSHELNSKGVRPFPVWKSRAFGHMEVCV